MCDRHRLALPWFGWESFPRRWMEGKVPCGVGRCRVARGGDAGYSSKGSLCSCGCESHTRETPRVSPSCPNCHNRDIDVCGHVERTKHAASSRDHAGAGVCPDWVGGCVLHATSIPIFGRLFCRGGDKTDVTCGGYNTEVIGGTASAGTSKEKSVRSHSPNVSIGTAGEKK